MDVETAYLHSDLDRPQFMSAPPGFTDIPAGSVLQLKKALYGLHQSGRLWNLDLVAAIKKLGYVAGEHSDPSVYVRRSRTGQPMILGSFVDDIPYLYTPEDAAEMAEDKVSLTRSFKMKDLGPVQQLLGMRVTRQPDGSVLLDQEAFVRRLCATYGIGKKTPSVLTPEFASLIAAVEPQSHAAASQQEDAELEQPVSYATLPSICGGLGYATHAARCDLAHIYNLIARQQSSPTEDTLRQTVRALQYAHDTCALGLRFTRQPDFILTAFSDASWGGPGSDASSMTGGVFKLAGCAVSWISSKQSTISLSSSEAEYVAASEAAREIVSLRRLLEHVGCPQLQPTVLFIDNETTIRMSTEEGNQERRKHINIKYHYIRQLIDEKEVAPVWIPTGQQQADIMTKGVSRQQFIILRDQVMGHTASVD